MRRNTHRGKVAGTVSRNPRHAPRTLAVLCCLAGATQCVHADWPQWGGVRRDFQVPNTRLADRWPESGPAVAWKRKLGDGYSSIVVSRQRLFSMFRDGEREHIIALRFDTGDTIWQRDYVARFLKGTDVKQFGPGPLATPLVEGQRLFTVGVTGILRCSAIDTGQTLWQHSLVEDLGGSNLFRGYSASPLAYGDSVIVTVGGTGHAVMAFRQADGEVLWRKHDFAISHASPLLIRFAGQDQLVVLADKVIVGLDPGNGEMLWQHPHTMAGGYVSTTPVWGADGRLFFSGAYGAGSWCLRLNRSDNTTHVEQLWHNPRMRVHHSNVLRFGDHVYGSSGDFSAFLFTAMNVKTGKVAWQDRGLRRASCLGVDGKLIVLQEDGLLLLASLLPKGLKVHSQVQLFEGRAWTPPTLSGRRLFVRNRTEVLALDLP